MRTVKPASEQSGKVVVPACDACRQTGEPVENIIRDGIALTICEDPSACRRRATRAGIWKQV